ncbi:MAG: hypothetical protein JO264_21825 [Acidisphaera sp.]|nr:hypothetical protein [Acidisphaera sp.]
MPPPADGAPGMRVTPEFAVPNALEPVAWPAVLDGPVSEAGPLCVVVWWTVRRRVAAWCWVEVCDGMLLLGMLLLGMLLLGMLPLGMPMRPLDGIA